MSMNDIAKQLKDRAVPWDDLRHRRVSRRILDEMKSSPSGAGRFRTRYGWAAIAAAIIVVTMVGYRIVFTEGSDGAEPRPEKSLVAKRAVIEPASPETHRAPSSGGEKIVTLGTAGRAKLADGATLSVETDTDDLVEIRQIAGSVRYEIEKRAQRSVVVEADGVFVHVVGTVFTVDLKDEQVAVTVERGVVRVENGGNTSILRAGEALSVVPKDDDDVHPGSSAVRARKKPRQDGLGPVTENGSTDHKKENRSIEAVLKLVDVARRQGQWDEAAQLLREAVSRDIDNLERAPTLLFTLGNVEVARRRFDAAASAYKRCWERAPSGPLAEDARADEAVSRLRAGQFYAAQEAARDYLNHYPAGTRALEMKRILE